MQETHPMTAGGDPPGGDLHGDPFNGNPFESNPRSADLREIARAAARCFGTEDGRTLLAHLRAITIERVCGPQMSEAALRDLEGQRRLVHRLTALIDRGRRGD